VTYLNNPIILPDDKEITIGLDVANEKGFFYYMIDDEKIVINQAIDVTILSDEYADPMGFTGAFVGMLVVDIRFHKKQAHFKEYKYVGYNQ
jgi:xylan 1,4-beta-xylosidase